MCNNCIHKPVCSIYRATGGVKKCTHHMTDHQAKALEIIPQLVQSVVAVMPELVDGVAEKIAERMYADLRGEEDG